MGLERKIDFWGLEDDENLTHTEMDDAIESILDGTGDIKDLPETIEVCGFVYLDLPSVESLASRVLGDFIEGLDENYSNPDAGYTKETGTMKEAAVAFVTTVLEKYKVWACDLVKRETINVREWIKENRSDWLEDAE